MHQDMSGDLVTTRLPRGRHTSPRLSFFICSLALLHRAFGFVAAEDMYINTLSKTLKMEVPFPSPFQLARDPFLPFLSAHCTLTRVRQNAKPGQRAAVRISRPVKS